METLSSISFHQKTGLAVVCVAIFVDVVAYGVVLPLLPFYSSEFHLSDWALSFFVSAFAFGALPTQPFFGHLSDSSSSSSSPPTCSSSSSSSSCSSSPIDRRKIMMLSGLLVMFLTTLLYIFTPGFFILSLARLLQGAASACTWSAGLSFLSQLFPPDHLGAVMGLIQLINSLGALLGAPIGGLAVDLGGYSAPFVVIAGLCIVDGIGRLLLPTTTTTTSSSASFLSSSEDSDVEMNLLSSSVNSQLGDEVEVEREGDSEEEREQEEKEEVEKVQEFSSSSPSSLSSSPSSSPSSLSSSLSSSPPFFFSTSFNNFLEPFKSISVSLWFVFAAQLLQGLVIEYLNIIFPIQLDSTFRFSAGDIGLLLGFLSLGNAIAAAVSGWVSDRFVSKTTVMLLGLVSLLVTVPLTSVPFILRSHDPIESLRTCDLWSSPFAPSLVFIFFILGVSLGTFPALALVGTIIDRDNLTHHAGFLYGMCTSCFTFGMLLGPLLAGSVRSLLTEIEEREIPKGGEGGKRTTESSSELAVMLVPTTMILLFTICFWLQSRRRNSNGQLNKEI